MRIATVFIVEDDARLSDVLVRGLRAEGFEARGFTAAHDLLGRLPEEPPDALVIDIGLPDADGRDVCQALRAQGVKSPVLFLTARDALSDRLSGFSAGGDDYVTKPFDFEEVVARLHALMRRSGDLGELETRGLCIDPTERTASQDGTSVELTPTELRLLATLAARDGRVCARLELVRGAWPYGAVVHDNTLDVFIARLRRKLSALPNPPTIVTVHGTGYRLQ
jgi:two-component system response regulator MprA